MFQDWFSRGETTCPLTGAKLPSIQLTPNYALKALIQQWKDRKQANNAEAKAEPTARYPELQVRLFQHLSAAIGQLDIRDRNAARLL